MPKFKVRPCKVRDMTKFLPLARAYWKFEKIRGFQPKKHQKLITKILKKPCLGEVWVAEEGKRLIGYLVVAFLVSLEYGGISAEIDELYVDRPERGRGVGAALLKTAGKFLSQQGIVQISLRVGKSNHAAMRFYQKLGFQKRNEYLVMDRKR